MSSFFSQPAFQLYALCSAALVALSYGLGTLTGRTRDARKSIVNPEDVKVYHGAALVDVEHPDVQRVKRAHLNLIENAVPFFALGILYSLTDPNIVMARVLLVTFVGVRFIHAIVYLMGRQPIRAAAFAIGALINIVMLVQVVRAAL